MKNKLITYAGILLTMVVVLSTGNAVLSQDSPDTVLRERVEKLMQAKTAGKWDVIYTFYNADFRNTISQQDFTARPRNMQFKSFKIEAIEILPSKTEARVDVLTDVIMQGFDFKDAPEKQTWIKENDSWFLQVKPEKNLLK